MEEEQPQSYTLEDYNKGRGPLLDKMQLEWLEASPERVVGRMPVEGNSQPWGMLHGGANAVLVESIGSFGAWLHDTTKIAMGVEVKVNHLHPATKGWVTGTGLPLMHGKILSVWEVHIHDDEGVLTAFGTCTITLRDRR